MQNDLRGMGSLLERIKTTSVVCLFKVNIKKFSGDLDKMRSNLPLNHKEKCDKNQFLLSKENE